MIDQNTNLNGLKGNSEHSEKEKVRPDDSEKHSKLQSTFNTFQENSELLLKVLESVEQIHPCIGAAVLAFKVVINLELKRRENNEKAKLLLTKVGDMMAILVQLRAIRDGTKSRDQSVTLADKMRPLCEQIGEDIKNCGNLCDMYSKQILLVKILKASIYEGRLADMGKKLDDRQKELHLALSMFTVETVQSLNDSAHSILESVNMLQLFEMTRSPLEQKLVDFIKSKGGAERCMKDPTILKELIAMRRNAFSRDEKEQNNRAGARLKHDSYAPPGFEEVDSGTPVRNPQEIQLQRELKQSIDESLQLNMEVFARKFEEQRMQLKALEKTVIQQAERVIDAVQQGPHDRVIDKELRAIWKEMGWRLVVQTPKFALALHDYFITQHHDMQLVSDHFRRSSPQETTMKDEMTALAKVFALAKKRSEDKWALECLHISNMGPIREAFDADASGYVSVWEANQVISLRPTGWSLLQWLAYWASGRRHTITQYTTKICSILKDMHVLQRTRILPLNRYSVDHYLDGMKILDRVLTSVAQVPSNRLPAGELAERVEQYTSTEEQRMDHILQALGYEIDGQDTIELITSRYQIERNFFPLVYLLLRQHLAIVRAGCGRLFDRRELEVARQSLKVIFRAVKARVSTLKDLIDQRERGMLFRIQEFAFGMYENVYFKIDKFLDIPISDEKLILADSAKDPTPEAQFELTQLQDVENLVNVDGDGPLDFESCIGDHINGYWSGFFQDNDHNIIGGVVQFCVTDWDSRNFSREGSYHGGTLRVEGQFNLDTGKVEATITSIEDTWMGPLDEITHLCVSLLGTVDKVPSPTLQNQYTIAGTWRDFQEETDGGTVRLSQTPAWVHHLRWTPPIIRRASPKSEVAPPLSPRFLDSLATLRWRFALQVILYRLRSKQGVLNAAYCAKKLGMIKKSVQLLKHHRVVGTPYVEDKFTMEMIVGATRHLPPSVVRLCHWLTQNGWWPTVHSNSTCQCGITVVGHRFLHVNDRSGKTGDLCSHTGVSPQVVAGLGSNQIKSWRFIHRREVSELTSKVPSVKAAMLEAGEWNEPVICGLKCSGCEKSMAMDSTGPLVDVWACLVCSPSPLTRPYLPAQNSSTHRLEHHPHHLGSAGPWLLFGADPSLAPEGRYADSDTDSDTEERLGNYYSCESE
ncbi:hypothetical protein PM082_014157 [Marasmius tenuissimus]|nr:hypothetical protein PM082_014157 [Marasmius tenuissimus]